MSDQVFEQRESVLVFFFHQEVIKTYLDYVDKGWSREDIAEKIFKVNAQHTWAHGHGGGAKDVLL